MVHGTALAWMTPMAPGGSRGHADWCGPGSNMALMCQHGHRLQPRLWASLWPLVAPQTVDINIDPGCGRTMDPDMVLINCPGLDVILVPGGSTGHSGNVALRHQRGPMWQPRPSLLFKMEMYLSPTSHRF